MEKIDYILIVEVFIFIILAIGLLYFNTTKEVVRDSCNGYDWYVSDSLALDCLRCDFKFNYKLIQDGFDFRQRYLNGCKVYQKNDKYLAIDLTLEKVKK